MHVSPQRSSHVRYLIVAVLFITSTFSYGDRVVLSIVSIRFVSDLHLTALQMGYIFSAFSWAYVAAQIPAGVALDRVGTKPIYGASILTWSFLAALTGFVGYVGSGLAFAALLTIRLLSGIVQAPVFPGNGRVVSAWFPAGERATACSIFNSSQYFAFVLFGPLAGWLTQTVSWNFCFWLLGLTGIGIFAVWKIAIHDVNAHPRVHATEAQTILEGGGLGMISSAGNAARLLNFKTFGRLLQQRMLIGIYLGQFCINTLTVFFLTWFPVYLNQFRHMSLTKVGFAAAVPALCGSVGGFLGGICSDALVRSGRSVSFARKLPIVSGMLLAISLVLCNYTTSEPVILGLMSLAFFGKGFGALGWTVISDVSPMGMVGISGGLFNLVGNLSGITTPIVIGALVQHTGSFKLALDFVAIAALGAILSYLLVTGNIHRLHAEQLRPLQPAAA